MEDVSEKSNCEFKGAFGVVMKWPYMLVNLVTQQYEEEKATDFYSCHFLLQRTCYLLLEYCSR